TTPAALAAKAATTTIPIVFATDSDPVQVGLTASLSRPGGYLTGVSNLNVEVGPKRLELARELFPAATTIALLVDPANPLAEAVSKVLHAVAAALASQLHVPHGSANRAFDAPFPTSERGRTPPSRRSCSPRRSS